MKTQTGPIATVNHRAITSTLRRAIGHHPAAHAKTHPAEFGIQARQDEHKDRIDTR